jgi:hypothetical protein
MDASVPVTAASGSDGDQATSLRQPKTQNVQYPQSIRSILEAITKSSM